MDISKTPLLSRGETFVFHRLKEEYFYPTFLKEEISHLPETFCIRTEIE